MANSELSPTAEKTIDAVAGLLTSARSLLFITGAGLSADSGLPTYRGIGGLYNDGTAMSGGFRIEDVLSGSMMRFRPELTWKYLLEIERACRGATFNRGHEVIAEMESHFKRVWILTQNVDGFHTRAGSRNVIDIHGDLHTIVCTGCAHRERVENYAHFSPLPRCGRCDAVLRPDVVLFGEDLPQDKLRTLWRETDRGFDIVFTIGTTSLFPYITEPVLTALDRGIPTVEINPGRTDVSDDVKFQISLGAAAALERLWSRFREVRSGEGRRILPGSDGSP